MQILSAVPGRVRWHVPLVCNSPGLARAVEQQLLLREAVTHAAANPLTGNLLVKFRPDTAVEQVHRWIDLALDWAVLRPVETSLAPAGVQFTGAEPMARLLDRTRAHRPLVATMLSTSFAKHLLDASNGFLIGAGVDIATRGSSSLLIWTGLRTARAQLFGLGGLGLALWGINAVCDYVHRRSAAELASIVRTDLRNELFAHIERLDLAQIESQDVSEWMSLFEAHLARIHNFVKEGSDAAVSMAASGVSVAGSVLLLSPRLGLIQLFVIPALAIASRELLGPLRHRLGVAQRESDRVSALLHGNISSIPTIHAFATQDLESARVAAGGEAARRAQRDADVVGSAYVPVLKTIVGSGFMATLVHGGLLARDGTLAPGAYNAAAMSQLRLLVAVGHFGGSLENYQKTRLSLKTVFGVLDMAPRITTAPDAVPFRDVTRAIVLDDVVFAYEEDRVIVRGLRMRFPAKQTVGIVGSSGAGKTTVLKLLERFYDVQGGAVRYDDVDVRDLQLEDLRRSIAMVPQEVSLFAATVRDNIAYAKPEASDDEVRHAAEVAEAHEFITALPDGYHTRIGYGGTSLSAGQRQRLAIARVVLADRPILLFDEATSALDYKTEAAIQRSLLEVTAGRTTIIVAHRLATVRGADLIYVLDGGQVKEQGVHDDLIRQDGIYAAMWRVQTGEVMAPNGGPEATAASATRKVAKPRRKAPKKA